MPSVHLLLMSEIDATYIRLAAPLWRVSAVGDVEFTILLTGLRSFAGIRSLTAHDSKSSCHHQWMDSAINASFDWTLVLYGRKRLNLTAKQSLCINDLLSRSAIIRKPPPATVTLTCLRMWGGQNAEPPAWRHICFGNVQSVALHVARNRIAMVGPLMLC
jgi:hypothetical protein